MKYSLVVKVQDKDDFWIYPISNDLVLSHPTNPFIDLETKLNKLLGDKAEVAFFLNKRGDQ